MLVCSLKVAPAAHSGVMSVYTLEMHVVHMLCGKSLNLHKPHDA